MQYGELWRCIKDAQQQVNTAQHNGSTSDTTATATATTTATYLQGVGNNMFDKGFRVIHHSRQITESKLRLNHLKFCQMSPRVAGHHNTYIHMNQQEYR